MIRIAPSILAADQMHLGRDVRRAMEAGCDYVHVDIMDGHFVPNMSFGTDLVHSLHTNFPELKLDVHLMLDNPEKYLHVFGQYAWGITVHEEIPGDVRSCLETLRSMGLNPGLSLRPGTPAERARPFFDLADRILVMTVEPGFGGQPFRWDMVDKIRELRRMGYTGSIEADGGLTLENLPALLEAGLDVAVMGTAFYRSLDMKGDIQKIHAMGEDGRS